jgi:hypothetical protein
MLLAFRIARRGDRPASTESAMKIWLLMALISAIAAASNYRSSKSRRRNEETPA